MAFGSVENVVSMPPNPVSTPPKAVSTLPKVVATLPKAVATQPKALATLPKLVTWGRKLNLVLDTATRPFLALTRDLPSKTQVF